MSDTESDRCAQLEQFYAAWRSWAADDSVENATALARIEAKLEGMEG